MEACSILCSSDSTCLEYWRRSTPWKQTENTTVNTFITQTGWETFLVLAGFTSSHENRTDFVCSWKENWSLCSSRWTSVLLHSNPPAQTTASGDSHRFQRLLHEVIFQIGLDVNCRRQRGTIKHSAVLSGGTLTEDEQSSEFKLVFPLCRSFHKIWIWFFKNCKELLQVVNIIKVIFFLLVATKT